MMEEFRKKTKLIFCDDCNNNDLCYSYCKNIRENFKKILADKIDKKKNVYYYFVSNGFKNTRIKAYSRYKTIYVDGPEYTGGKYIHLITNIKDLENISQSVIKDLLTDFSEWT